MLGVTDRFRDTMATAFTQSIKTMHNDVKSSPPPPVVISATATAIPTAPTMTTVPTTEITPAKSEVDISINSLIAGMLLGCLCNLTTVFVVALVLIVATNQPFPEAVAESIGYKYPFRALQGFLTWIWTKVSSHMQVQAANLQSKED